MINDWGVLPLLKPPVATPLILPLLESDGLLECTSTISWLTQDSSGYNFSGSVQNRSLYIYDRCRLNDSLWYNQTLFEIKLGQCQLEDHNKSGEANYEAYIDYTPINISLELADALVSFVFIPLAAMLGLLLNILVVHTIKKHRKKDLKKAFYKFMSLNSKFNCLYCIIFVFNLINACLNQKIVAYLDESVKMCSNISYILITINRYMLIGREHSLLLERISKLELKNIVTFAVIFSSALNIGHIFQYRINNGLTLDNSMEVYAQYPLFLLTYSDLLAAIFVAYFAIKYALFFLVNTFVEIVIVRKFQVELREKRRKMEQMGRVDQAARKKLDEDSVKERRAITMVVLNSLVNFSLRFSEIFF